MKLFINLLLICLFTSILFAQDCKSKIIIQSDSDSIYVFINDSLITKTKYSEIDLAYGKYLIKLVGDERIWNSGIVYDTLTLVNCESKIIRYKLPDKIYLDSNPQDAYIFAGDSLLGNTPMFINTAIKNITLKKNGYSEYKLSGLTAEDHIKVNMNFIGNEKQKSFFTSTAFKLLAGTALALGTASAYFKLKADNKFDEYKITKDKSLLDQTNKYDLISGITFTALQINLGFIVYKLFSE